MCGTGQKGGVAASGRGYRSPVSVWRNLRDTGKRVTGPPRPYAEVVQEKARLQEERCKARRVMEAQKNIRRLGDRPPERRRTGPRSRIPDLQLILGLADAGRLAGLSHHPYYRRLRPAAPGKRRRLSPNRWPTPWRRTGLNSTRFGDRAVRPVGAPLLHEGSYYGHGRPIYRLWTDHRTSPSAGSSALPDAPAAGLVGSGDIPRLRGRQKGESYARYRALDVYRRYGIGGRVAPAESGAMAAAFIEITCENHHISPPQLPLHRDRGSAMTSKTDQQKRAERGGNGSDVRPYTSNDHPYSESAFKTRQYRPTYPLRFGSLEEARGWVRRFVEGYTYEHDHTHLARRPPATVHFWRTHTLRTHCEKVLADPMAKHPERFPRGIPQVPRPRKTKWINPPAAEKTQPSTKKPRTITRQMRHSNSITFCRKNTDIFRHLLATYCSVFLARLPVQP